MNANIPSAYDTREVWEFSYNSFLRIMAFFYVILTIQSWMKAIGISTDSQMGFDTMPSHWQFALAALCVLHPVTALGLWGLFAWGIAVWLISIFTQLAMHLAFSDLYGSNNLLVVFHITCFSVFVVFQIALRFATNRR